MSAPGRRDQSTRPGTSPTFSRKARAVSERIPGPGPETWLRDRLAAGKPAETWKPMAKIGRCEFSGYEISDQGNARSLDRIGRNGKPIQGGTVTPRPHKDGYGLADFRCDNPDCKRAHTLTMQKVALWTFVGARPHGMNASHLHGPAYNWVPEAVGWEPIEVNEGRKEDRPPPPEPTHPCRNASTGCPNLVINEDRRCEPCCAEAGRDIADKLRAGIPLPDAAKPYGYKSMAWPYQLSKKYGGYTGTMTEAMTQRPPLKGWRKRAARLLKVA